MIREKMMAMLHSVKLQRTGIDGDTVWMLSRNNSALTHDRGHASPQIVNNEQ